MAPRVVELHDAGRRGVGVGVELDRLRAPRRRRCRLRRAGGLHVSRPPRPRPRPGSGPTTADPAPDTTMNTPPRIIASDEVRRRGAAATSDAPTRMASVMTMLITNAASLSPARNTREMLSTSTATIAIDSSGTRNGSSTRVLSGVSSAVPSAPSRSLSTSSGSSFAGSSSAVSSRVVVSLISSAPSPVSSRSISSSPCRGVFARSSSEAQRKNTTAMTPHSRSPAPIFMISPAACWSSSVDSPKRCGTPS